MGSNPTFCIIIKQGEWEMHSKDDFRELVRILKTMDVPKDRYEDTHWLVRNLRINNSNHPKFHIAMAIIRDILGIGV